MNSAEAGTEDVVVTRVFAAPPELLYDLWTMPEHVRRWWRPEGFARIDLEEMEVRVGGVMRMRMKHHDGHEYLCRNTYRELDRPGRIAYFEICDEDGRPFHAARVRVDFLPHGSHTRLTLHARLEPIAGRDPRWTVERMRQGWHDGWRQNLQRLEELLSAGVAEDAPLTKGIG